jgi:hypothetical protein
MNSARIALQFWFVVTQARKGVVAAGAPETIAVFHSSPPGWRWALADRRGRRKRTELSAAIWVWSHPKLLFG